MHLHSLLDHGITVLTASRRLAHALRLDYARHAQARGLTVWPTPHVLPWAAWLRQQWLQARASSAELDTRLLTPAQARVLWDDVVASSDWGKDLLNSANASRLAARSWQLMHDYLIPIERLAAADSAEARALYAWCVEFMHRCESLRAMDETRLTAWAHTARFVPQQPVALAGFDVVQPAIARLLEHWRSHDKVVEIPRRDGEAASVTVIAVRDAQAELEFAARWSRAQLESGKNSVGIIVSDLHSRRSEIQRVFEDVFAPGLRTLQADSATMPVVIAAPNPLASYPVIEAAMLVLRFATADAPSTHAGRLLRTPFIAGADSESDRRARADFRLRVEQRARWDWFELERWAAVNGCEQLQLAARAVCSGLRADAGRARASRWAERFHSWLKAAGWPGQRALSSAEHQTVLKFHAVLAELGALDAITSEISLSAALARLQALLHDTPFEPETEATAVTVIDATTVAGMRFDAVWVAGLDATRLPGPVNPDPLLPLEVQRAAGLPGATAGSVMGQAKVRLQRWLDSAPEVILSWPEHEAEAALQPSPLLASWPRKTAEVLRGAPVRSLRRVLFEHRPTLNEIVDDYAPRLHSSAAQGGAMTLELQSRCPFRAQAELRLRASVLPRVTMGVEPLDRGTILHRVLADFWSALRDQDALLALDEATLNSRVRALAERHVMHALRPTARYRMRLASLEIENVVRLVARLLALEKQRAPFTVSLAEASEPYTIGGLAITLRPDRIDRLASGGQMLIDYKLGDSHQPRQWLDVWAGRPRRPQLPLYGLAHGDSLQALAFIILAPGTVEYRGWSSGAVPGPGVAAYPSNVRLKPNDPADWAALMLHWRLTLTQLADQYVAGAARVDPLPQECAMCHLSTLCRIQERASLEAGAANDD